MKCLMKCLKGRIGNLEIDELKELTKWQWRVSGEPSCNRRKTCHEFMYATVRYRGLGWAVEFGLQFELRDPFIWEKVKVPGATEPPSYCM